MKRMTTLAVATLATTLSLPIAAMAGELAVKAETKLDVAADATKDSATTAKIKTKLAADSNLSATDIHVETTNGVVTLSGEVDNKAQVALAEKTVKNMSGVAAVHNNLEVKGKS